MEKYSFRINGLFLEKIKPDAVVAGCVEIFENAFPNPIETIQRIEHECATPNSGVYWTQAETIGGGVHQNIRTNKLLPLSHLAEISENKTLQSINNIFYSLLLAASNSYAERYQIHEPLFHEGYNVLRYSDGEEYKPHYDGGTDIGRSISAITYLNGDYEGGELEFVNFGIKIKPEPGMLILFPSNYAYRHVAHPVTKGTKYAIVTWIRDRQV
jgi:predicted 2-oxoglutarate/Fe(II)-dependent dioxygenase YbiX